MIEWTFSIHIVEALSCFLLGVVFAVVIFLIAEYKDPSFSRGWDAGYEYGKTRGVLKCKDCKFCDQGLDEDGHEFYKCIGPRYGGTKPNGFCDMGAPK